MYCYLILIAKDRMIPLQSSFRERDIDSISFFNLTELRKERERTSSNTIWSEIWSGSAVSSQFVFLSRMMIYYEVFEVIQSFLCNIWYSVSCILIVIQFERIRNRCSIISIFYLSGTVIQFKVKMTILNEISNRTRKRSVEISRNLFILFVVPFSLR